MKQLNLIIIILALLGTACRTQRTAEFEGHWIEIIPANPHIIQGITLQADGRANSIGNSTLQYQQWRNADNMLILKGVTIVNGQRIDFTDTLHVIRITADSMILGKHDSSPIKYYKVNDPNQIKPFNVVDSLSKDPSDGKLITRVYEGKDRILTIYNYEYGGDGVYKLTLNHPATGKEQSTVIEKVGRMYTLRGDAEDRDAVVYQLVSFSGNEEMNFLYLGDKLELLNKKYERSKSKAHQILELKAH